MGKKARREGGGARVGAAAQTSRSAAPSGPEQRVSKKKKKKKSGGGGDHDRPGPTRGSGSTARELKRASTARPPPAYRLRGAAHDDASASAVLSPGDAEYDACVARAYPGFHVDPPRALPDATHAAVTAALKRMTDAGYFHRDVLAAGKSVSPTFVQRVLVGDRGMTYHYQKLRIFAHPWDDDVAPPGHPFRILRALNETLIDRAEAYLRANPDPRVGGADFLGPHRYNVTLVNLMEPAERCVDVPLKPEGRYGMGDASVSWHSDSSLQNLSTVAVYHQCEGGIESRDDSWHVALRALDGVSPALRVPLPSHATYYMARDFNANHHHAVLAGNTRRFSSTHRVAVVERDTFEYIKRRCEGALALLPRLKAAAEGARGTETAANGASSNRPASLAETLQALGETHRDVEFQWIRMFWLQGTRHARLHAEYWTPRVEELTQAWDAMELGYRWALGALRRAAETGDVELRAYDMAAYLLGEVAELREEHAKRSESGAYALVPEDCRPVRKPAFADASPLPENLKPVLATLEAWRNRAARARERRGARA